MHFNSGRKLQYIANVSRGNSLSGYRTIFRRFSFVQECLRLSENNQSHTFSQLREMNKTCDGTFNT